MKKLFILLFGLISYVGLAQSNYVYEVNIAPYLVTIDVELNSFSFFSLTIDGLVKNLPLKMDETHLSIQLEKKPSLVGITLYNKDRSLSTLFLDTDADGTVDSLVHVRDTYVLSQHTFTYDNTMKVTSINSETHSSLSDFYCKSTFEYGIDGVIVSKTEKVKTKFKGSKLLEMPPSVETWTSIYKFNYSQNYVSITGMDPSNSSVCTILSVIPIKDCAFTLYKIPLSKGGELSPIDMTRANRYLDDYAYFTFSVDGEFVPCILPKEGKYSTLYLHRDSRGASPDRADFLIFYNSKHERVGEVSSPGTSEICAIMDFYPEKKMIYVANDSYDHVDTDLDGFYDYSISLSYGTRTDKFKTKYLAYSGAPDYGLNRFRARHGSPITDSSVPPSTGEPWKVYFKNSHYETIHLAMYIKTVEGDWVLNKWYKIEPGNELGPFTTKNNFLYFYAKEKTKYTYTYFRNYYGVLVKTPHENYAEWEGSAHYENIDGESRGMIKSSITFPNLSGQKYVIIIK